MVKPSLLLLLPTLLLAHLAHSATLAVGETLSGGHIYITDQEGQCPANSLVAEVQQPNGNVTPGCWTLFDEENLLVQWSNGRTSIYPIKYFSRPDGTEPRKDI